MILLVVAVVVAGVGAGSTLWFKDYMEISRSWYMGCSELAAFILRI